MEYGLIKDTTLKSMADSLREKGIIPKVRAPKVAMQLYSENVTSETDLTPTREHTNTSYSITAAGGTMAEVEIEVCVKESPDTSETGKKQYIAYFSYYNLGNATEQITRNTKTISFIADVTKTIGFYDNNAYTTSQKDWVAYKITVYPLDDDGNRIIVDTDEVVLVTPEAMMNAVNSCLMPPPEYAMKISGNCKYKFAGTGWNWFLNNYADKIVTEDITAADYMFFDNRTIERIPMTINLLPNKTTGYMFQNCSGLVEAPKVNHLTVGYYMFDGCTKLISLNGNKFEYTSGSKCAVTNLFTNCDSLRDLGGVLDAIPDEVPGDSIYGYSYTFSSCRSLAEITNLPYVYSTYNGSYCFSNCFQGCHSLKELTFRNQVITTAVTKTGAVIDLTSSVGFAGNESVMFMAGWSYDKLVKDDATYQALKDDPGYWTTKADYSRYNRNSALNTINSLPDVASVAGLRNTIKFKGTAGAKTDAGAINTLTPEELAIADQKGWTVAFA